jgi:Sec-independent protein translocase protein TatA
MFGISFSEIILILLIGIIIFGPKQLPQIAAKVGIFAVGLSKYIVKLKQEIYAQSGFKELEQAKTDLTNIYIKLKNEVVLRQPINTFNDTKFNSNDNELVQQELDFEQQPELF